MVLQLRRRADGGEGAYGLKGVAIIVGRFRPYAANDNGRRFYRDPVFGTALLILGSALAATLLVASLRTLL
ncbi:hypothetical protein ACUN0C_01965 [Faunimonas sp. B44]|uniref:hypothetical protein n=1 Tax=Faunimonas sp. B44 TaxID=3461493 RepID=UPI004043D31A